MTCIRYFPFAAPASLIRLKNRIPACKIPKRSNVHNGIIKHVNLRFQSAIFELWKDNFSWWALDPSWGLSFSLEGRGTPPEFGHLRFFEGVSLPAEVLDEERLELPLSSPQSVYRVENETDLPLDRLWIQSLWFVLMRCFNDEGHHFLYCELYSCSSRIPCL